MKILKTAVIGLGRAGWQMHIPQVIENSKYEFVAVVDPVLERLNEAKNEFGVTGYLNCESLFGNESLDVIVIASPTHFHADQAITAFKNGIDVLCDKPITISLCETDRMISAMKEYNRKLLVYMPHRAYAEGVALKKIIEKNLIGNVYMIKRGWTRYRIREDWQAYRKYGGGELRNSGAHFIDQLLYLSGSKLKNISSYTRKIATLGDAEDVAKVLMETENGMILDLDISMAAAYPIPQWQILGERGSIILDESTNSWKVKYYLDDEFEGIDPQNSLAAKDRSYCDNQAIPWHEDVFPVDDFEPIKYYDKAYEFFALDEEPFVPIEETREIMRIIEESLSCSDKDSD